jgi:hypothetical protein
VPGATIDLDDRFHSRTDREGNYRIGIVGRAWIRMTVGKPGFSEKSKWLNTKMSVEDIVLEDLIMDKSCVQ